MKKKDKNKQKMKVQPVKKLMRNVKYVKSLLRKNMNEICEGDNINDTIGDDDVASVEELEMGSSTSSLNKNNDLVSVFDAPTCSGDNVYDFFEN